MWKELDGSVLLCWEKSGAFCHRRLVAEWLEDAVGEKVQELDEDSATAFELMTALKEAQARKNR